MNKGTQPKGRLPLSLDRHKCKDDILGMYADACRMLAVRVLISCIMSVILVRVLAAGDGTEVNSLHYYHV